MQPRQRTTAFGRCYFSIVDSSLRVPFFWAVGRRGMCPRERGRTNRDLSPETLSSMSFPMIEKVFNTKSLSHSRRLSLPKKGSLTQTGLPLRNCSTWLFLSPPHQQAIDPHKESCAHLQYMLSHPKEISLKPGEVFPPKGVYCKSTTTLILRDGGRGVGRD